ncbi:MAG: hypothetical protein AAGD25_03825 [Cyanobacteria bacterium P01_F01_bin.150]
MAVVETAQVRFFCGKMLYGLLITRDADSLKKSEEAIYLDLSIGVLEKLAFSSTQVFKRLAIKPTYSRA